MKDREIISEYWSDDGRRKSEIIRGGLNDTKKYLYVKYYEDGKFIAAESYDGHSLQYYEAAAENYVMGIKQV